MKLRNKKTGNIFDVAFHSSYNDRKIVIGVEEDADQKCPKCNFDEYESLEEFFKNWEDVKKPLIKDEKIRKFLREWAKMNGVRDIIVFDKSSNPYIPAGQVVFAENVGRLRVCFRTDEKFDTDKIYTVNELCGDDEK